MSEQLKTLLKLRCDCCGKMSSAGATNIYDEKKRNICSECLKLAPSHYGYMVADDLIGYIKERKRKKWWQIWKKS